jgi:hypothetical protein
MDQVTQERGEFWYGTYYLAYSASTENIRVIYMWIREFLMEVLSSSKNSVVTSATRRNVQEDDILHSHRREKLKFCNMP